MKTRLLPSLCLLALASLVRAAGPTDLIRLYEEEILAHDLYVALGKVHPDVMPLQNIPHSEMRHREAMAELLKAEGIELPKPPAGRRFVSEDLDEIFAQWLAEGVKSVTDACRVGVRLEDHDIAELRKAQADFPKHKDTLGQLEAASNNHLRAFHRNLTSRGGKYTPEALSEAELNNILNGTNSCGAGSNGSCGIPLGGPGNGAGENGKRNRHGRGQGKAQGKSQGQRGGGDNCPNSDRTSTRK